MGAMNPHHQQSCLVLLLCAIIPICCIFAVEATVDDLLPFKFGQNIPKRSDFPPDFLFGAATSAYQYHHQIRATEKNQLLFLYVKIMMAEKIADGSNGDVAADSYNFYKLSGRVNQKGVQHYNDVINEVIAQGLTPFVTLFHFDTPQALEDEYGGFLSNKIANDFRDFADVCFKEYGDRVKHWITLNEPLTYCREGYASGGMAPGRCTTTDEFKCDRGDSATEPYIAGHNQLLAHAAAVALYRQKYQATQKGMITITLNSDWFIPYTSSKQDADAAQRALDFNFGWFMDPITTGDYPKSMKDILGKRLPKFTAEESNSLKGSFDYLGLNYYTSRYASDYVGSPPSRPSSLTTKFNNSLKTNFCFFVCLQTIAFWLYVYPEGFKDLLLHIKDKYNNPIVYITENGK
ncbi:unnamed protein product [Linum tenue]|uniref:Uncharacterized protein n=1 Tax=Linum tenue TaxID=586396 RepID=A0AAV0GZG5_9ROSI|nr:unnamed protein product [Linum tenue]